MGKRYETNRRLRARLSLEGLLGLKGSHCGAESTHSQKESNKRPVSALTQCSGAFFLLGLGGGVGGVYTGKRGGGVISSTPHP